ncbi:MAG TPA: hypothetical protein VHY76_01585 [Acetobacteraceae bacterium]|jgi:hypothetical protein|nr:hypothetical protein [Acetobacteraceae bacterium]
MSNQPQKPTSKQSVLEDKKEFGKPDEHTRQEDTKASDEMKRMGKKAGEPK